MRKTILILAIVGGVLAALGGVLAALGLAALAWFGRRTGMANALASSSLALSVGLIGVGFGLALAWAGWRGLAGAPGRPFGLPRWGWWLLILFAVLVTGQIALASGFGWLAALAQVAACAVPIFLLLSLAVGSARRAGGRVGTRPAVGSLAWGSLGGAGIAVVVEMLLVIGAAALVAAYLSVTRPDLLQQLQTWALSLQRSGRPPDLSRFAALARSPWVWLAALGFGCVLAPLIEESVKALAVPLFSLTGRRLTRLEGFLLGAAAGGGFALLEGATNGSLALQGSTTWWSLMLLRGGAAAMHCLTSGLVGLGWQAGLTERRWGRGIGLALLAMTLHGAWNLSALGTSLISLGTQRAGGLASAVGGLFSLALTGLLGLLCLSAILALAIVPRQLAEATRAEVEIGPEALVEDAVPSVGTTDDQATLYEPPELP